MQVLGPTNQVREYEFTETQNGVIGELAAKMRFVGSIGAILGVLLGVSGILPIIFKNQSFGSGNIAALIAGGSGLLVGIWTRGAADKFQNIVDTQGSDIQNLMSALDELRRVYSLQRILFITLAAILILAVQLYFLFIAGGRAH